MRLLGRTRSADGAASWRAVAVLLAFYFSLTQAVAAAHGFPTDAAAPAHNAATCVICLLGGGNPGDVPQPLPTATAPEGAREHVVLQRASVLVERRFCAPSARGPPTA
jgi:hypothetical protein